MRIEPDMGHFRQKVKAQLAGLDKDIHVGIDVDRGSLSRVSSGMRGIDRDSRRVSSAIAGANRNFKFFQNTISLIKWPAYIAGAGGAAQALSALGAGAVGLTGALGPLSGALVALPAAFGAAGQGASTALLAFSGLGDALGAMSDQQAKAGQSAVDSASQHRSAAEQVKGAEEALASAQRTVKVSQEDLTQARKDAVRELQDLRLAAEDAALGEKRASLTLAEARRQLREVQSDPNSTALDVRDALLSVDEAQQQVKESKVENTRAQKDSNEADKKGVQGNQQVIAARRSLADAVRSVADSTRSLRNAQLDANAAMASGGAAADLLQQKMNKLTPAGRSFAKFLFSLKPQLDKLRQTAGQNLFPGLEKGLRSAMKNLPALDKVIGITGRTMEGLAEQAGKLIGSKAFGRDFAVIGKGNARFLGSMGKAGLNLADALRHIMVAAQPLIKWMGRLAAGWTKNIAGAAKAGRETGKLAHFFAQTREVMERLFSITGHLAGAFSEIGKAAAPLGRSILAAFDKASGGLERWTKSLQGQNALAKYFHDARAPLFEMGRLIRDVVKDFFKLGASPGLTNLIHQVRTELLPVLTEVIGNTTRSLGPALVNLGVQFAKLFANFAGASGPLTTFVNTLTLVLKVFNSLPGPVKSLIVQIAAFGAIMKALSFTSAISGISTMVGAIKWVGTTSKTAAASTTVLRLQLLALAIQEKVVGALVAMRAAMAAMIPTTIGLTFAIRALVSATVIGALVTAAILIATHWKQTKDVLAEVWSWIKANSTLLIGVMAPLAPFIALPLLIATRWQRTKDVLAEVWSWIKNAIGNVAQKVLGATKAGFLEPTSLIIGRWQDVRGSLAGVWGTLGNLAQRLADEVLGAFRRMGGGVKSIGSGMANAIGTAATVIRSVIGAIIKMVQKAVGALGDLKDKIPHISLPDITPGFNIPTGPLPGGQRGMIVPGSGSGDTVPLHIGGRLAAMVEPREMVSVANRNATAALMDVNQGVPRFARGGVPPIKLRGRPGGLHSMAQGAINKVRNAGNTYIGKHKPKGGALLHGSGPVEATFAAVAKRLSRSKTATLALGMAGFAESGMRDLPGGDASSQGALQLLASTAAGLGVSPHDEKAIASLFFTRGFYGRGGANALAKQGLPAHLVAQSVQGSATESGSNYLAQQGNARSWMRRFRLQRGGVVQKLAKGGYVQGAIPPSGKAIRHLGEQLFAQGFSATDGQRSSGGTYHQAGKALDWGSSVNNLTKLWSVVSPIRAKLLELFGPPGLYHGAAKFTDAALQAEHMDHIHTATDRMIDLGGAGSRAVTAKAGPKPPTKAEKRQKRHAAFKARLSKALSQVQKIGLTPAIQTRVDRLGASADQFEEWASAAASIGTDTSMGVFRGQTEAQLLQQELDKLLELRNVLVLAYQIMEATRDRLKREIAAKHDELKRLQEIPVQNRTDAQKRKIQNLRVALPVARSTLAGLNGTLGVDAADGGGALGTLADLQGSGGPFGEIGNLSFGQLGGRILDVQVNQRDVGASGSSSVNTESADLLRQLLQQANQRFAVSQAQYAVMRDTPLPPYGGSFAGGGTVPGPMGAPRTVIAHGGEEISNGSASDVRVAIEDHRVRVWVDDVEQIVDKRMRRTARGGNRSLPGRAGGLT